MNDQETNTSRRLKEVIAHLENGLREANELMKTDRSYGGGAQWAYKDALYALRKVVHLGNYHFGRHD